MAGKIAGVKNNCSIHHAGILVFHNSAEFQGEK